MQRNYHRNRDWPKLRANQIRVLRLYPGRDTEPLRGDLEVIDLSQDYNAGLTEYEALSYCWGDLSSSNVMVVGDELFNITPNLFHAIHHVRSPTESMLLWIDQVCINQSDVYELTQQVHMMLDIFAKARRVYAWLGLSTEHSGTGIMVLHDLAGSAGIASEVPAWQTLPPSNIAQGLRDLMERVWWQRIWTVQEVAVARNVVLVCGSHRIEWSSTVQIVSSFVRAIKLAVVSPQWRELGLETASFDPLLQVLGLQLESGPEHHIWRREQPAPDLLDLAYDLRERKATDPRDRLYALASLRPSVDGRRLIADYSKTVEVVYSEFDDIMTRGTGDRSAKGGTEREPASNPTPSKVAPLAKSDTTASAIVARGFLNPAAGGAAYDNSGLHQDSTGTLRADCDGHQRIHEESIEPDTARDALKLPTASISDDGIMTHSQVILTLIEKASNESRAAALSGDLGTAAHLLLRAGGDLLRYVSVVP